MTDHEKKRRFGKILVGVLAAILAVPASAAAYVQIGGHVIAPSQVSAGQASADLAPSARLIQIGGELISPSQSSAWQSSADRSPATSTRLMQLGGELISPSQSSAWQALADLAPSASLVQIGGDLVSPSRLSAWQTDAWNRARTSSTLVAQTHDSGSSWGEAGITVGAGLAGLVLLLGGSVVVLRRRRMPGTLANMHP